MIDLTMIGADNWLKLNSKLQLKKNAVRKELKSRGVLVKGAINKFDNYSYFSEAQYKELFTELFSVNSLELKFNELEYSTFEGTERQANGRMTRIEFVLIDVETGFFETTIITGEGIDKGDKAGYKAYTGALKYYLADTFMVATGDDPEKESPDNKMNNKKVQKATHNQINLIKQLTPITSEILNYYHVERIEDITLSDASNLIKLLQKKKMNSFDMR